MPIIVSYNSCYCIIHASQSFAVETEKQISVLIFTHERYCQNFHHPRSESNSSRYKILSRKTTYLVQFDGNHSLLFAHDLEDLVITVTNENLIVQEIKRRLNSGNACYHSAQKL
jgi:hypothetical protein